MYGCYDFSLTFITLLILIFDRTIVDLNIKPLRPVHRLIEKLKERQLD